MLFHKKYNVDPSDVIDGSIKWEPTGNGAFIIAEYGGRKYFVKRATMGERYPAKDLAPDIYKTTLEKCNWIENKQKEMRSLMASIDVDRDHIVKEEENFWDEYNTFTTVTRLIPDENKGFDYKTLDARTFIKLCYDMAVLIQKTHAVGVTHGDLKEANILIRKSGSDLVPYLIDFDSSYPSDFASRKRADGKPMLSYPVVFTPKYESPEIAIYNYEDEGVIDAATITNKTDVFTLALIFHRLWTGEFPAVVGDDCSIGEAVYIGEADIIIDPKFDVEIGGVNKNKLSDLMKWMLVKDATTRPTAEQVVQVLSDKLDVEDFFEASGAASKFDQEPHLAHAAALEIFDKDTLKAKGVKAFLKVTQGGQYKYCVRLAGGGEEILTVDEVIARGYGKAKAVNIGALWPEDAKVVEYVDESDIAASGVVAVVPKEVAFRKFYFVAMRSGGGSTMGRTGLLEMGIVKKKITSGGGSGVDAGAPWAEHGSAYNKDELAKRNIVKVEAIDEGGAHVYRITVKNDDGTTFENVVKATYMKFMGFITK